MPTLSTTTHHPQRDASPIEFCKSRYYRRLFSSFSCTTDRSQHIQTHTYYPTPITLPFSPNNLTHIPPPSTYKKTLTYWRILSNRTKVSRSESILTLITPWADKYNLQHTMILNITPIPYTNTAISLGVTNERGMSVKTYTDNINTKANTGLNVVWALTNKAFGQPKDDITLVYKQFIRPILTYAHLAWQPDTKETHIQKFQTTLTRALRMATGYTQTSSIPHLHRKNTSTTSQTPHTHETDTSLHVNRLLIPPPTLPPKCFCAHTTHRARPHRIAVSILYRTELDSFLTHIKTVYANKITKN